MASAYKANVELANLDGSSVNSDILNESIRKAENPLSRHPEASPSSLGLGLSGLVQTLQKPVLASFKIPIGSAEAELIFTGASLGPDDFDALRDYIDLFKKQYERKQKAAGGSDLPTRYGLSGLK